MMMIVSDLIYILKMIGPEGTTSDDDNDDDNDDDDDDDDAGQRVRSLVWALGLSAHFRAGPTFSHCPTQPTLLLLMHTEHCTLYPT